ncbi:MAG: hypothetical protein J3R72DRAFT_425615 [Linnemannia gamsii]|nr:MAG: hypothetical protein J3R72DRAFT_425615 [Linnemannia gamsii]
MVSSVALNSTLTIGQTDALADPPTDPSSEDRFVEGLRVNSAVGETPISNIGTATHQLAPPFYRRVYLPSGQVQQQELSIQMAHMIKLQEASAAKQEEMSQMQKQAQLRQERMEQLQEELNQLQKASDMLKFGISAAGVAVPAISYLVRADVADQAATYLQQLKDIEPMMEPVINWLDKVSVNEGEAVDEFAKQMKNKKALAGADLRKLDTFLSAKDGDKMLGNLYRTVTDEGHIKWVCIDHYRENYQEARPRTFSACWTPLEDHSTRALARSVYELDIVFDWACTTGDLEVLEGALKKSIVSILRLNIRQFRTSNLSSTSAQYGVLLRIKGLPNMRIIHVVLSKDIVKLLSIQPKTPSLHCKLSIDVVPGSFGGKEIAALAGILKTNSTLVTLDLQNNSIRYDGAKALAEALKTNSTLATLDLQYNWIGGNGAEALAEALKSNSTVTIPGMSGLRKI